MRVGVDLGGTKIEVIAIDEAGRECFRSRVPTPASDYQKIVEAVTGLVLAAEKAVGKTFAGVGIGAPGAVSPGTGLVKNSNTTSLIGKPLDRDLSAALGRPVRIANDANCFALSEASDGAGAGAPVVFGVILGTGTGGGLVVGGRVLTGANAIAGEWGHNSLPWPEDSERPGPSCYCGRSGCIETFLCGPALAREFEAATGRKEVGTRVAELAGEGDAAAEEVFARYEGRLARALSSVINIVDPDVIVVGGGLSKIERLYRNIPKLWTRHVFSDSVVTKLARARHGDSSGVRGAAWLF